MAIDSSVFGILGDQVLKAVYTHLKEHYGVTADELPNRLDALHETLEGAFGAASAKTIGRAIAKRFYFRMGLEFNDLPNCGLQDYLEQAKVALLGRQQTNAPFR